jgi:hypothetical protein
VGETAQELSGLMARARPLIRCPDQVADRGGSGGGPGEPWNSQAAHAYFGATAEVRQIEADLRLQVAGTVMDHRGGSDENTAAALEAVTALAEGLPAHVLTQRDGKGPCCCDLCVVSRRMARRIFVLQALPAIDLARAWRPLPRCKGTRPHRCPYCGRFELRYAPGTLTVTCFMPGCLDADGEQPFARVGRSRVGDLRPVLVWNDGLVEGG